VVKARKWFGLFKFLVRTAKESLKWLLHFTLESCANWLSALDLRHEYQVHYQSKVCSLLGKVDESVTLGLGAPEGAVPLKHHRHNQNDQHVLDLGREGTNHK